MVPTPTPTPAPGVRHGARHRDGAALRAPRPLPRARGRRGLRSPRRICRARCAISRGRCAISRARSHPARGRPQGRAPRTAPCISPHLPASPHISLYLMQGRAPRTAPCISPHLPTSAHISLYLLQGRALATDGRSAPHISPHLPTSPPRCRRSSRRSPPTPRPCRPGSSTCSAGRPPPRGGPIPSPDP